MRKIFHLAIPTHDLDAARKFYANLGCTIARSYDDRITVNFFGDQVVCHLTPDYEIPEPKMYPRHFGMTFEHLDDFEKMKQNAQAKGLPFFKEPFTRFSGKREEHRAFFLLDPSNNLLEFKWYNDPEMMH